MSSFGERERLSASAQSGHLFQLDEVVGNSFLGSLQKIGMTKTQSNDVPENLWRNEVFTTVGINKDRHARIIIMRPETRLH